MSDHSSGDGSSHKSTQRRLSKFHSKRQSSSATFCLDDYPPAPSMLQRKDIDSLNFISYPQKVCQIISSFDERKRDIVASIGFGGILKLPSINSENKSFSYWLLFHMRWYNACIAVGDNIRLSLNEEHIAKITGLKSVGRDIAETRLKTVDDKLAFVASRSSFLGSNTGVLQQAELFVQTDLPSVLSKQSVDNFKTAFIIFIIGMFLAPSSEHPDGNTNFWGALQNPDEIPSFNWCSYVLSNLKAAARLVNCPNSNNKPLSTVIGCPFILQIFYLDNIDFGELNLRHDLLPRWTAYSDEYINAMVSADTLGIPTPWNPPVFGKHEVQRSGGICYKFRQPPSNNTPSGSTPSPRVRPIRHRRSSLDNPGSPDISDEDTTRLAVETAGHDSRSPFTSFDTSFVDFNALFSSKYPGQIDYRLLDDWKTYNARCLNIISTSHRALAVSIANENAEFAMKMIDHYNNSASINNSSTPYSNLPPRRRRQNDFTGGTDSSTDGEDNNMLSKRPRITFPFLEPPCGSNRGVVLDHSETMTHHMTAIAAKFVNTAGPSRPSAQTASLALDSKLLNVSNVLGSKDANCTREVGDPDLSKCYSSDKMNPSDFVTPLATLKMPHMHRVPPNGEDTTVSLASFPVMRLDALSAFDPNSGNIDDDCQFPVPKRNASTGPSCESHFFLNLQHLPFDTNAMKEFYKWISNTNSKDLDSNWIMSNIPRFLKISGHDLKDQFVLNKTMNFEVFDASIRRFKELDTLIYQPVFPLRWRHLLESDYARNVLDNEHPSDKKPVLDQFVSKYVNYEVSRCRMFFIPMFGSGSWWCYSWDIDSSVVYIIDPSAASSKDDLIINKHMRTIQQLSASLTSTITELFNGWVPNFASAKFAVVRIAGMPYSSKVSGLLTLFCIWNFDGHIVSAPASLENIANFKAFLLSQIMFLQDNKGCQPSSFIPKLL